MKYRFQWTYPIMFSPHDPQTLYVAGNLVFRTTDLGSSWEAISPDLTRHDPATAYLAATRYKLDDTRPMLYKTTDYGQTWTSITAGLTQDDYTRVVREDPARPGLLYAGTETGVYVSFDQGESWQPLRANLPVVPVYDLAIKDDNLIAATHGRSFWILDDLSQLRQLTPSLTDQSFVLLQPRDTHRIRSPFRERKPTLGKIYRAGLGADVTYSESLGKGGRDRAEVLGCRGEPARRGVDSLLSEGGGSGDNPQHPRRRRGDHTELLQQPPRRLTRIARNPGC